MLMKIQQIFLFLWEIAKITLMALVIVVPIRTFVFQPFIVKGNSMEPNFHSGDYLVIDELSYFFREPQRGEVIVLNFPGNISQRYIKRVIGLPGEKVEIKNGKIAIYQPGSPDPVLLDESDYIASPDIAGQEIVITIGPKEYFVLGDNRAFSSDSRNWGPLPRNNIIGRVLFRLWPIPTLQAAPNY